MSLSGIPATFAVRQPGLRIDVVEFCRHGQPRLDGDAIGARSEPAKARTWGPRQAAQGAFSAFFLR
jgi:hypothetical protein